MLYLTFAATAIKE